MNQIIPNNLIVKSEPLTTPVLFLIFNRPDLTAQVFDVIRKVRPQKLFVRADGPRNDRIDEAEQCQKTRDIVKRVNWECEVYYDFSEINLGCKTAVSSGVNWFFDNIEEGIILEDDCLPNQSFFWFCQELLQRYRDDERIMQISGNNYLFGKRTYVESYYFSKLNDVWGWATWKRAWKHVDIDMTSFPEFKVKNQIENYLEDKKVIRWLMSYFQEAFDNEKGIWSPAWTYAMCTQNGLIIVPSVNLVSNIGFGRYDSTSSSSETWSLYGGAKTYEIKQMIHPKFVLQDKEADRLRFEIIRRTDPRLIFTQRAKSIAKTLVRKAIPWRYRKQLKRLKTR